MRQSKGLSREGSNTEEQRNTYFISPAVFTLSTTWREKNGDFNSPVTLLNNFLHVPSYLTVSPKQSHREATKNPSLPVRISKSF